MTKNGNFNNLIDVCLKLQEEPGSSGKVADQFMRIIGDYFFEEEKKDNKNIELIIGGLPLPGFLEQAKSIYDINIDDLRAYIAGATLNDSLAGKIMLSQHYLKTYYPHHAPVFNKLPEEVRFELMDLIKDRNESIITAFEKMQADRAADRKRKVLTLVALILKNVHLKNETPLNKLPKPADEIIRSIFNNADEVFNASQKQTADLLDDSKIKQLIKSFFAVRQFKDITEIASLFKEEIAKYKKRTMSAGG